MTLKPNIVIIGAGSATFTKNLIGDLLLMKDMDLGKIALVDIDVQKLEVMDGIVRKMAAQAGRNVDIISTTDRLEALPGADYVISTISCGGAQIYKRDLQICDKYGVHPVIGDIIGPTGMFRLLRAYPSILAIVRDMEKLCPDAYFFNYTNPMAPICLALSRATTVKTYGFCHSVQGSAEGLANYLNIEPDKLHYWAAGINHMSWYLSLKVDGVDVYPQLMKLAQDWNDVDEASKREGSYSRMFDDFTDRVRFEIMKQFGYYVSESPYHMSEYVPYFRKNEQTIKKWGVDRRWWLAHELANDEYYDELKSILRDGKDVEFSMTREYAPKIIRANVKGEIFRANLNVMNTGLITNIPDDCCVEVPCYADCEGIHPCYVGKLPDALAGLNMSNIGTQKLMARAANEKKLEWIYQGIQLDPLTAAMCELDQIRRMTAELIQNNIEFVGDFT
ncbi:MAG: glycoside hydrolase [Clostridia bacterium]|nr:glycoside hydrolase [Clostridia bacterium]